MKPGFTDNQKARLLAALVLDSPRAIHYVEQFADGAFDNARAPIPATPLANSMTRGMSSQGRAGNKFSVPNSQPQPIFETVLGFGYLKDLVPDAGSPRMVELQADDIYSAQTTLVISYRQTEGPEVQNFPFSGELARVSTPYRDFRMLVRFGVGSTQVDCEVDVSEGRTLSVPGSVVNVSLYSNQWMRTGSVLSFGPDSRTLETQAHLASGFATVPGCVTDRVLCPFQAEFDPLDPPTIEQWLADLTEAICDQSLITNAEGPPA